MDDDFDHTSPAPRAMNFEDLFARLSGLLVRAGAFGAPVLRSKCVAALLDVSERAVRKMMDRGEIPWTKVGRQRVVPTQLWIDRLNEQAKSNEPPRCGH